MVDGGRSVALVSVLVSFRTSASVVTVCRQRRAKVCAGGLQLRQRHLVNIAAREPVLHQRQNRGDLTPPDRDRLLSPAVGAGFPDQASDQAGDLSTDAVSDVLVPRRHPRARPAH